MKHKLLLLTLAISSSVSFAEDYSQFQAFDNQISIGYGMKEDQVTNNNNTVNNLSDSSMVNFEGERLLNNGIWIDLNANMTFNQGEANIANNPVISNYGFNGKVGYAFQVVNTHLLVTPYFIGGVNNNGLNIPTNNVPVNLTANEFFATAGGGGRIEYRINNSILVYADQNAAYNKNRTSNNEIGSDDDFYSYTSTIGAKFNLVKDFQLGVKAFYTNYQPDAGVKQTGNYLQAQSSSGALVSLGLTY
ncbi:MAG: hypothetical protein ORN24_00090 [Burkholderiales bacterium]|nr:hypothetical protein [Burkholderiales bacterium]